MLAYPSGRLIAIERVIVGAAFVAFVAVLGVAPALFFDPADEFCSQCPENLALITGRATTADAFADAGFRLSAATAASRSAWLRLDWRIGCGAAAGRGAVVGPVRCISAPSRGRTCGAPTAVSSGTATSSAVVVRPGDRPDRCSQPEPAGAG